MHHQACHDHPWNIPPRGPGPTIQEEEGQMELTSDIQYLRSRRDELERRMRQPGGVRIIEERELLQIRQRLQDAPRPQERSAEMISIR